MKSEKPLKKNGSVPNKGCSLALCGGGFPQPFCGIPIFAVQKSKCHLKVKWKDLPTHMWTELKKLR
ncbi:MAG: hypothetical protein IKB25_09765 [Lentisphaeria bacterium]|nr:hypothetical protein [Lentisphaeria bacterium]